MATHYKTVFLEELAAEIAAKPKTERILVAIAGAPGSGKSTTAEHLQTKLEHMHDESVQIVPMDGFHYDDAVLAQLGLAHRKGAPDTFDVGGLQMTLSRLAGAYLSEDVAIPVFDRSMELSRANARLIDRQTRILLVEGNYLLLKGEPWACLTQYFDLSVMVACDEPTLQERLLKRWVDLGFSVRDATRKVELNDLPNAKLVTNGSRGAQFILMKA